MSKPEKYKSRRTKFLFPDEVFRPNLAVVYPFVWRLNPVTPPKSVPLSKSFRLPFVCRSSHSSVSLFVHLKERSLKLVHPPINCSRPGPFVRPPFTQPNCFTRYSLECKYCSENGNCFSKISIRWQYHQSNNID